MFYYNIFLWFRDNIIREPNRDIYDLFLVPRDLQRLC